MTGLLLELDPGQDPESLKKPPSLHGARLRRKVPLDKLTKELRGKLSRTTRVLERRVERELRRSGILADLKADAEKRGEKQGPIGRGGIPLGPERERVLERTFRFDGMEAVARLFEDEEDAFRLELESVLGDSYEELFNSGGNAARIELGARGSFRLRNTAIADALEARANRLAGDIAEDVFDRLKTVIADGFYLEGRGIPDVSRALREEFDWLSQTRADRIARTETLSVTEEAQHTVYKASGIHFKRWITTLDGKERETHFEAHGQVRAIDEAFDVGAALLMWPGDPDGPPEEICNCRCATQPIVTADQLFSDADIWRGDVDPDEFARDREEPRDELTQGPSAPPPSDTEDLEFADEEPADEEDGGEKRVSWQDEEADRLIEYVEQESAMFRAAKVDTFALGAGDPFLSGKIDARTLKDLERWLKAEREYERDDLGRFGSGGGVLIKPSEPEGGGGQAPATDSTVAGLPEAVGRELMAAEAEIIQHDYESGVVVGKDGSRLETATQEHPSRVRLTKGGPGDYMVHNHPSSASFSPADVKSASALRLAEDRVAANDGTVYRMSALVVSPESGYHQWPTQEKVGRMYNKIDKEVSSELTLARAEGVVTREQALYEHEHMVWSRAAPRLGLKYTRDDSRRKAEAAAKLPRIDPDAVARAVTASRERYRAERAAAMRAIGG